MDFPKLLQLISPFFLLAIPFVVLPKINRGEIRPNAVTFLIRSIVAIMNMITYFLMTDKEIFKSLIMVMSTVSLSSIFITCLVKNGIGNMSPFDKACGILSIVAIIIWKTSDHTVANITIQLIIVLASIPTMLGVVSGRNKEIPLPWMMATAAYVLNIIALYLLHAATVQMIHLFVCAISNTVIAILAHKTNKV